MTLHRAWDATVPDDGTTVHLTPEDAVKAGPADDRVLTFCDDPDHTWVRSTWDGMELDPSCPATSGGGSLHHLASSSRERHS